MASSRMRRNERNSNGSRRRCVMRGSSRHDADARASKRLSGTAIDIWVRISNNWGMNGISPRFGFSRHTWQKKIHLHLNGLSIVEVV